MWERQKVPGKILFKMQLRWLDVVGAYSNLRPGGLCSLEIMKLMCGNDATVQTQIIMYSFKVIYVGYFLTQPRTFIS